MEGQRMEESTGTWRLAIQHVIGTGRLAMKHRMDFVYGQKQCELPIVGRMRQGLVCFRSHLSLPDENVCQTNIPTWGGRPAGLLEDGPLGEKEC
ncbi:hypothetical protein cypCar_00006550 [Cyprinus carpio]|nr:hypothetical protein cypCar_00006550 [Cyprinus carpio]